MVKSLDQVHGDLETEDYLGGQAYLEDDKSEESKMESEDLIKPKNMKKNENKCFNTSLHYLKSKIKLCTFFQQGGRKSKNLLIGLS